MIKYNINTDYYISPLEWCSYLYIEYKYNNDLIVHRMYLNKKRFLYYRKNQNILFGFLVIKNII